MIARKYRLVSWETLKNFLTQLIFWIYLSVSRVKLNVNIWTFKCVTYRENLRVFYRGNIAPVSGQSSVVSSCHFLRSALPLCHRSSSSQTKTAKKGRKREKDKGGREKGRQQWRDERRQVATLPRHGSRLKKFCKNLRLSDASHHIPLFPPFIRFYIISNRFYYRW